MPSLAAIRARLLSDLQNMFTVQGPRKEAQYGIEYGIDRVSVCESLFQKEDLTFYAHSKGTNKKGKYKVVELYLSPWPPPDYFEADASWPPDFSWPPDCIEAAIKVTHGMDVDQVEYGDENRKIRNRWFMGGVLGAMVPVLSQHFAGLMARPCGKTERRTQRLATLYEGMGFVDTGHISKIRVRKVIGKTWKNLAVLKLELNNPKSLQTARSFADVLLKKAEPWT